MVNPGKSNLLLFEALAEGIRSDERVNVVTRNTMVSLLATMCVVYVERLSENGVDVGELIRSIQDNPESLHGALN